MIRHPQAPSPRQAGVGIVTAIFLLVVLAGLGTAMVGLYATQQSSADLDLQGARAYQAARSGLEWGLFQQRRNGQCNTSQTVAMPAGTSLSGFTVTVGCRSTGAGAMALCQVTSTACNIAVDGGCATAPNNADYVRRSVEAELTCTQ